MSQNKDEMDMAEMMKQFHAIASNIAKLSEKMANTNQQDAIVIPKPTEALLVKTDQNISQNGCLQLINHVDDNNDDEVSITQRKPAASLMMTEDNNHTELQCDEEDKKGESKVYQHQERSQMQSSPETRSDYEEDEEGQKDDSSDDDQRQDTSSTDASSSHFQCEIDITALHKTLTGDHFRVLNWLRSEDPELKSAWVKHVKGQIIVHVRAVTEAALTRFEARIRNAITDPMVFQCELNDRRSTLVHIHVDASNITIGMNSTPQSSPHSTPTREEKTPRHHLDTFRLVELIAGLRNIRNAVVTGSEPHVQSPYWDTWRECGFRVNVINRFRIHGRSMEQAVDDVIHSGIQADICKDFGGRPRTLILLTGDGNDNSERTNFPEVIENALRRGWFVELWSWEKQLSGLYRRFSQAYYARFKVCLLDPYRDLLTRKLVPPPAKLSNSVTTQLKPVTSPASVLTVFTGTGCSPATKAASALLETPMSELVANLSWDNRIEQLSAKFPDIPAASDALQGQPGYRCDGSTFEQYAKAGGGIPSPKILSPHAPSFVGAYSAASSQLTRANLSANESANPSANPIANVCASLPASTVKSLSCAKESPVSAACDIDRRSDSGSESLKAAANASTPARVKAKSTKLPPATRESTAVAAALHTFILRETIISGGEPRMNAVRLGYFYKESPAGKAMIQATTLPLFCAQHPNLLDFEINPKVSGQNWIRAVTTTRVDTVKVAPDKAESDKAARQLHEYVVKCGDSEIDPRNHQYRIGASHLACLYEQNEFAKGVIKSVGLTKFCGAHPELLLFVRDDQADGKGWVYALGSGGGGSAAATLTAQHSASLLKGTGNVAFEKHAAPVIVEKGSRYLSNVAGDMATKSIVSAPTAKARSGGRSYNCNKCYETFASLEELMAHLKALKHYALPAVGVTQPPLAARKKAVVVTVDEPSNSGPAVQTVWSELLDSLVCPISLGLMEDPVMAPSGVTYERRYLERWVAEHGTDPVSRAPLGLGQLQPNLAVKQMVALFKSSQGNK